MALPVELPASRSILLRPRAPYHFDANLRKPSHFPSSDTAWTPGTLRTTMFWGDEPLGLRFRNRGTPWRPRIYLTVYSRAALPEDGFRRVAEEVRWRFNLDQDIATFCRCYRDNRALGPAVRRWRGMKPVAANSLYETLMVYVVLQNAVVRRSIQMLEALFQRFGSRAAFDGHALSVFWPPEALVAASEEELRSLKVGYRARTLKRITDAFAGGEIDEIALRGAPKEEVAQAVSRLYGIGPASLEYLLFEDFYFLDALTMVPPWERKIMSRLLFHRTLVPEARILRFFRECFPGYEKLAFHYMWEDLFWRRDRERVDWLEREIRR